MPRLPGNPVGDLLKRVDRTLGSVDPVLGRVDGTLGDATEVLQHVRGLLTELESELALLREVPEMKVKLDEIHALVSSARHGG
ncbi:MAG: hypothetical protein QOI80_3535 [Solirubrobacteraceae bacterium]|nr:hypothetical protein [Solirubrobacteraceae bacterium]